tara:strand:+ start:79 stop:495 length:417 start_codon:yes stop_codon:yes gene_type:complete
MKLDIKVEDIMNTDFPILDSSLDLGICVKKINNNEACVVLDDGFLHSVLCYDDILKAYLSKKKNIKIRDVKSSQDFVVVKIGTDIFNVIKLMRKKNVNFVIVKNDNYLGLITKKEILEINQKLFDLLEIRDKVMVGSV